MNSKSENPPSRLLFFQIDYILFYPGRPGEKMFSVEKAYDALAAIKKLKTQNGWYKKDKHPKARIRVLSVVQTEAELYTVP